EDAGDVARGAERADLEGSVGVRVEFAGQLVLVDVPVGVFVDGDDVGDGFPPGQFVGVVLEGADEYDGAFGSTHPGPDAVLLVERCWYPQPEYLHEFVDRAGRAAAGEDDDGVVVTVDGAANGVAGVFAQASGLQAGAAGFGVGVGVAGQHFVAQEVFDEAEGA